MKHKVLYIVALLAIFACGSSPRLNEKAFQTESNIISYGNLKSGIFLSANESGDTIGFICGRFFSRERTDTLYCIAIGASHYSNAGIIPDGDNLIDTYIFTNEEKRCVPLYLTSFYFLNNVKVQDLDKDGMDEVGMVRNWWIGSWYSYNIFDFDGDDWKMLCRPIVFYNKIERDWVTMEIARSSEKGDFIIAQEDGWTDGCEEIKTAEKQIMIERIPIENDYDTCFSIPGGKKISLPNSKKETYMR